jgi:hypothetical protein
MPSQGNLRSRKRIAVGQVVSHQSSVFGPMPTNRLRLAPRRKLGGIESEAHPPEHSRVSASPNGRDAFMPHTCRAYA